MMKRKLKDRIHDPLLENNEGFFERVYEVVRKIPYGRVSSYGAIAAYLSIRSSARMVGWALNSSFGCNPPVPAHRVVNRKGMLTGKRHFTTPEEMQILLEKEGIKVENDQVVEFGNLFWDPYKDLI